MCCACSLHVSVLGIGRSVWNSETVQLREQSISNQRLLERLEALRTHRRRQGNRRADEQRDEVAASGTRAHLDHLVGAGEQRGRDIKAERVRGFEVNHHLKFGGPSSAPTYVDDEAACNAESAAAF